MKISAESKYLISQLQVWMVVQRKWMYLEGIFIGGDIRSQLPEEAKRFDQIDKTFKKVRTRSFFSVLVFYIDFHNLFIVFILSIDRS